MDNLDKDKFAKLLVGFSVHIYGKETDAFMMDIFWLILKKYSWEKVEQAFFDHVADTERGQFMPKPADIKRQIEGSKDERVLKALTMLDKFVKISSYTSVVFEDPVIPAMIQDLGGRQRFYHIESKDYSFVRNEFTKRYRNNKRDIYITSENVFLGGEAMSNQAKGLPLPEPVYLGNKEICQKIFLETIAKSNYFLGSISDS